MIRPTNFRQGTSSDETKLLTFDKRPLSFFLSAFSSYLGGYAYVTVFDLPALRQPHSVFGAVFVHAWYVSVCFRPSQ